jgi:hypothetical protein
MCRKPEDLKAEGLADEAQQEVEKKIKVDQKIHMDLTSDTGHIEVKEIAKRAARFFCYLIGFMISMATIGLIPTVFFFVIIFMRLEGPERWSLVLPYAIILVTFIYAAFDQFMSVPWPQTLLGSLFPALKAYVPSL